MTAARTLQGSPRRCSQRLSTDERAVRRSYSMWDDETLDFSITLMRVRDTLTAPVWSFVGTSTGKLTFTEFSVVQLGAGVSAGDVFWTAANIEIGANSIVAGTLMASDTIVVHEN